MVKFKQIPLTHGKFAIVDGEDFEWLSQWKWHVTNTGYAGRDEWNPRRKILMHREIVCNPNGKVVDHIDRNKLNNTKVNLRICTQQQNTFNRVGVDSKYKGVKADKRNGRFIAQIMIDYKVIHLGSFTNEIAAVNCYNFWAEHYHGEFALLNEVPYMTKDEWEKHKLKSKTKKSKNYTGVSYKKDKKKWKAYVNKNGKQIHIGYFDTELEGLVARTNYIKNIGEIE